MDETITTVDGVCARNTYVHMYGDLNDTLVDIQPTSASSLHGHGVGNRDKGEHVSHVTGRKGSTILVYRKTHGRPPHILHTQAIYTYNEWLHWSLHWIAGTTPCKAMLLLLPYSLIINAVFITLCELYKFIATREQQLQL